METINRLTDILVSMNTPADRGKLFKIIKMLYGLMGLQFSEEAEPMGADPAVLEYFIFSFTADFGEIIKDYTTTSADSTIQRFLCEIAKRRGTVSSGGYTVLS